MSVAVGIITAPRQDRLLPMTIASLRTSGFTPAVHVFAEPNTFLYSSRFPPWWRVHQSVSILGPVRNWLHAALTMLRDPAEATHILLCEDDFICCDAAGKCLDFGLRTLPTDDFGYCSLYTPHFNAISGSLDRAGWQEIRLGRYTWGAVALCFSRESLYRLLFTPFPNTGKTFYELASGQTDRLDYLVSDACLHLGLKMYAHVPSLVDHTGDVSTLGHRDEMGKRAYGFNPRYDGYLTEEPCALN